MEDGRKQVPVTITFDALGKSVSDVKKFALQLIGKKTDYKGAVWLDDLKITKGVKADVPSLFMKFRLKRYGFCMTG